MALTFNTLLHDSGISPEQVRLLRHQEVPPSGRTPYVAWREQRDAPVVFEKYQSCQSQSRRSHLKADYWAAFVVPVDGRTMFVGLYAVGSFTPILAEYSDELSGRLAKPDADDLYTLRRTEHLANYAGCLFVDWGPGTRTWIQIAARQPKEVTEITRVFEEPQWPGYLVFRDRLSNIMQLPVPWLNQLSEARGVYVLTCPKTGEWYIGSASSDDGGFRGRWEQYARDGHGGNVILKSRERSDYQVAILEVAGSSAGREDVLAMEEQWKLKLQARAMGLNAN